MSGEQQVRPGRHQYPRLDRPGTVHTFQFRRVPHRLLGVFFVAFGALLGLVPIAGLFIRGFYQGSSERPDAGTLLLVCGMGLAFAWFGIRYFRYGVQVSGQKLTIRGLRTKVVDAVDIRAITLQPKRGVEVGSYWVARVELTSGKNIWIENLECGPASEPPKPERMAVVDEIRALLGLAPVS